ncbi:MAG: SIR2 family protein [Kosmotogaceae bacterium]
MLLTDHVDIPTELIRAQEEERLVVFAGAGVSMASPSNIPGFVDLAKAVAKSYGQKYYVKQQRVQPPDVFLGSLNSKNGGLGVHEIVKQIMSEQTSRPSQLHSLIPLLFKSARDLKIVTTNYDAHFLTVLKNYGERYDGFDIFRAPALPRGDDFRGIVYLHGNVEQDSRWLVVTNRDFGRAYLTEGWARDFLRDLYLSDYTILFIGYSHRDTIVDYLARGLDISQSNRYALVSASDAERWKEINVIPVSYPLTPEKKKVYYELQKALENWTSLASSDIETHTERIGSIAGKKPAKDQKVDSYLTYCLNREDLTVIFCRFAEDFEWVEWLDSKAMLDNLFREEGTLTEIEKSLTRWFVKTAFGSSSQEHLTFLVSRRSSLNPYLVSSIVEHMADSYLEIPDTCQAEWLNLILNNWHKGETPGLAMLKALKKVDVSANPWIVTKAIQNFFSLSQTGKPAKLSLFHRQYDLEPLVKADCLKRFWSEIIEPNLDTLHEDILSILTSQLMKAVTDMSVTNSSLREYDSICSARKTIEESEPESKPEWLHIYIDLVRDTILYLIRTDNKDRNFYYEWWKRSRAPILWRILLYAVSKDTHCTNDYRTGIILDKGWLTNSVLKEEVSCILIDSFCNASKFQQKSIVETLGKEITNTERIEDKAVRQSSYASILAIILSIEESESDFPEIIRSIERVKAKVTSKQGKLDNT